MIATISLIYMAIFVLFVFPASIIIDKGGLCVAVLGGILLTLIGMWVKCLINHAFWWVLVGQFVAALGQPLISCSAAKLAALWFGDHERVIATTIGMAAMPIGVAIGYVFPSFFVTTDDSLPQNVSQARHDVYLSLLWQAIIGTGVMLISALLFREKPVTPPTKAHATVPGILTDEIKACLRDKNLMFLVVVFGIILGIMSTYGTIIGIICVAYDYTDD